MNFKQYCKKYQLRLNEQQEKAVCTLEGAVLLLAVPGSGKTTVIVARIGYLILCLGVKPEQILTLTYSVAAARDMKQRFEKIFGQGLTKRLQFRTIHSFCVSILKEYEKRTGKKVFELILNSHEVITKIYIQQVGQFPTEAIQKELVTKIAYCKNKMLTKQEIEQISVEKVSLYEIYMAYENYKIEHHQMDFDDQLLYSYRILKQYPNIRQEFKKRHPYIQVDEAQDTSKLQHEIIRLLVEKDIFMVGDEDQSIYQFRAAYPEALLKFEKQYPKAKVLLMETNYRSTPEILQVANLFIKQNENRVDKNIVSVQKKGKPITYHCFHGPEQEYQYLVKSVTNLKQETAILYRNNDSSIPLLDRLQKQNIPFHIREQDTNFFSDKLVVDVKTIVEFSFQRNNLEKFKGIYYKLNCGISKKMLAEVAKENRKYPKKEILDLILETQRLPLWQAKKILEVRKLFQHMPNQEAKEALACIFEQIGYSEFLQSHLAEGMNPNAIRQKRNILYAIAKEQKGIQDFLQRLQELEELIRKGSKKEAKLTLSTIHASKGLEYDKVYLMDVVEGILPSVAKPKSVKKKEELEKKKQYEEEVRLFYVGMTRAKTELEILAYQRGYLKEPEETSEFVKQILGKKG